MREVTMSSLPVLTATSPTVRHKPRRPKVTLLVLLAALLVPAYAEGQVFTWTREQMVKYTAQNPY